MRTDGLRSSLEVVLGELLAKLRGFYADYGIIPGVVADRASEHFGPDHPLSQAIHLAYQSVLNNEVEKILGPFASGKCVACYDVP